jgi:hypothetical protein
MCPTKVPWLWMLEKIWIVIFSVVTPCNMVGGHQRFASTCYFHPKSDIENEGWMFFRNVRIHPQRIDASLDPGSVAKELTNQPTTQHGVTVTPQEHIKGITTGKVDKENGHTPSTDVLGNLKKPLYSINWSCISVKGPSGSNRCFTGELNHFSWELFTLFHTFLVNISLGDSLRVWTDNQIHCKEMTGVLKNICICELFINLWRQ